MHPQSTIYFSLKEAPSHLVFAELVSTTRPFLRNVLSVKYQWIEPLLQRRTKLDVNKLIGRDFQVSYVAVVVNIEGSAKAIDEFQGRAGE